MHYSLIQYIAVQCNISFIIFLLQLLHCNRLHIEFNLFYYIAVFVVLHMIAFILI